MATFQAFQGTLSIVGDGTTTVFTIAHNLTVLDTNPNAYFNYPDSTREAIVSDYGGCVAGADATNAILTFTNPPAEGVQLDMPVAAIL